MNPQAANPLNNLPTPAINGSKFPVKKFLPGIIALVVLILAGSGYFLYSNNKKSPLVAQLDEQLQNINPNTPQSIKTNFKKRDKTESKLKKQTRKVFNSSADKPIIDYLNLAAAEKALDARYDYYLKAFQEMGKSYAKSKDDLIRLNMLDLKLYARAFPDYKESEFKMPQ